ncbi:MAG: hypothetical protein NVSMB6_14310 [Burkholderiaceae bacterium]
MDFEIPVTLVQHMLGTIGADSQLARRLTAHGACHGRMVVPSSLFDADALNTLYTLSRTHDERPLMFQMLALDNIRRAPQARTIPGLEKLIPGLAAYLSRDAIDGWLYRRNADGVLLPWLVHGLRHILPGEGSPYVVIDLVANTMQAAGQDAAADPRLRRSGMTTAIVIDAGDIANRTIPELLAEFGYFKECEEFKREYQTHADRFLRFQTKFGRQFVAQGTAFEMVEKARVEKVRLGLAGDTKCVNDEEVLERRFETAIDSRFWKDAGVQEGFDKVPLHCYLRMFHLEWHRTVWVHVQNLEEYRYQPALREKLILPEHHRDLIDILTSEMDTLTEDFVEGKSGGTTILCKGAPGLGKTLTAEVYAEVVGKPLYRVHSGQLGTTAASVEENLSVTLRRAARWDAILLLDEADVYIRRRDNDLQHNAIVAEFLRTLEHFSGLLFMTTNRLDDIDDAILSRCIATIRYDVPPKADAIRLWRSLAGQFNVELSTELIDTLSNRFPQASGRDIKELLKLTSKYCRGKGVPLSAQTFERCATFRGIR